MVLLANRVVVIIGASSGVGRALAVALANEKCILVLIARRLRRLQELSHDLLRADKQARVFVIQADATKESEVAHIFDHVSRQFNRIDILVNCAGKGLPRDVENISKAEWDEVMRSNMDTVFLCSKQAYSMMIRQKFGHIITVCSVAAIYGAPGFSAYCAAKHAVAGFVQSLRFEARRHNIKVSAMYPARIDTEFFDSYDKKPKKSEMVSASLIASYLIAIMKRNLLLRSWVRLQILVARLVRMFR